MVARAPFHGRRSKPWSSSSSLGGRASKMTRTRTIKSQQNSPLLPGWTQQPFRPLLLHQRQRIPSSNTAARAVPRHDNSSPLPLPRTPPQHPSRIGSATGLERPRPSPAMAQDTSHLVNANVPGAAVAPSVTTQLTHSSTTPFFFPQPRIARWRGRHSPRTPHLGKTHSSPAQPSDGTSAIDTIRNRCDNFIRCCAV
jgi:hypothetical protein